MRYPSFLFGSWSAVRQATSRKVKDFGRGASLAALVDDWVDTEVADDPLVLLPSSRTAAAFHCYAFIRLLGAAVPKSMPESVFATFFDQAVQHAWSFTGLLSQDSSFLLTWEPSRVLILLDAAARHWPELDAVGSRYTMISTERRRLWAQPTNIKYALGQIGLSVPELQAPLPAGGLRELIDRGLARTGS